MSAENNKAAAKDFIDEYYRSLSNRGFLEHIYRDASTMMWDGEQFDGRKAIVEKLTSLPFDKATHKIATLDVQQPPPGSDALVTAVTGELRIDGHPPTQFSQTFHLDKGDNGRIFVSSNVFQIICA
ncbi:nuclear transport factor 2 family protein [Streptomyces sp. NPDC002209]|uniref:nuclear transport factor 2 family protein n=1 Tax=Streptomyces sp. NPDC002209 TaxID=3364638 RepID=UPI003695DD80